MHGVLGKMVGGGWRMALALPLLGRGEQLWVDGYFSEGCVLQRGARVEVRGKAAPGARVEVDFRGERQVAEAGADGGWTVGIGPYAAGGPDALEIRSGGERIQVDGVLVGDVWVCLGQSNMAYNMAPVPPWTEGVPDYEAEIAAAGDQRVSLLPMPRFVYHEEWPRVEGRWRRSGPASVRQFSAVAWYMARRLREREEVPLGMIVSAIGSTGIESWLAGGTADPDKLAAQAGQLEGFHAEIDTYCREFAASFEDGAMPPNQGPSLYDNYIFTPSGCFNALVAPLARYPVAGWVWYQGEGNAKRAAAYKGQLERLIRAYRERWKQPEAPFIVVQLPGWLPPDDAGGTTWAELREQQRKAVLETPRSALVVTLDAGDAERIHPRDKRPVGERCADAAAALKSVAENHYGMLPAAARMGRDNRLEITFVGSQTPRSLRLAPGFAVTLVYADGTRAQAGAAELTEHCLAIRCPDNGRMPRQVEYAYTNLPQPALFLADGSPVSPFKLDIAHPHDPCP